MTDTELVSHVMGTLDPTTAAAGGLRRGGHLLLALPKNEEAFSRALRLYQPQRRTARGMVAALRGLERLGLRRRLLPKLTWEASPHLVSAPLEGITRGTCGVLLGSPEHKVRRAIASYQNEGAWEVAKISFGKSGASVLEQEARALNELGSLAKGVPRLLGLHQGNDTTVLRMPYLTGKPVAPGESGAALGLLEQWITDRAPQGCSAFPGWKEIESALSTLANGTRALDLLSRGTLRPVICHADFARWNLLSQPDGNLMVLDWEWGHAGGMPGIDLVHYFLQDARLVERLKPSEAIRSTIGKLRSSACQAYLAKTGWSGDTILPIIACLAYKQGAGHQENTEVLEAALLV